MTSISRYDKCMPIYAIWDLLAESRKVLNHRPAHRYIYQLQLCEPEVTERVVWKRYKAFLMKTGKLLYQIKRKSYLNTLYSHIYELSLLNKWTKNIRHKFSWCSVCVCVQNKYQNSSINGKTIFTNQSIHVHLLSYSHTNTYTGQVKQTFIHWKNVKEK